MGVAGTCFVIAASDEFKILAKNDLGDNSHGTPAIANNRMYLRTFKTLRSIGGK